MQKTYAYTRVSTGKQDSDRQLVGIQKYAKKNKIQVDEYFEDVISGKIKHKPSWEKMKKQLGENDTVIVYDFDRIGRDWDNIIAEYNWLVENNINLKIVTFELLNINANDLNKDLTAKLVKNISIQIACYSAQSEREKISVRTKEKLQAMKEKGQKLGRTRVLDYDVIAEAMEFYINSDFPILAVANKYGLKHKTLMSYLYRRGIKSSDRDPYPKYKYTLLEKQKYGYKQ